MGFFLWAHDNIRAGTLKVSKLVFELSLAQNELKRGDTHIRWLGRSSTAVHEEDHREEGFREMDLLSYKQICWISGQGAHSKLRWGWGKCWLGTTMENGEEKGVLRGVGCGVSRCFRGFLGPKWRRRGWDQTGWAVRRRKRPELGWIVGELRWRRNGSGVREEKKEKGK